MAHVAKLSFLTEELVTSLTGLSIHNEPRKFSSLRESTLRRLRQTNYARTNQFDVQAQLEGYVEKFHVYNKDKLGHALKERLDELSERSDKWTPEVLHLLLELADRPAINSRIEDLESTVDEEIAEVRYQWEDWASEDPSLRDKSVWRNIDYGAGDSEDEYLSYSSAEDSAATENTTFFAEDVNETPQSQQLIVHAKTDIVAKVRNKQFWRLGEEAKTTPMGGVLSDTKVQMITSLESVREILFMLSGLPTMLFTMTEHGRFSPKDSFGLQNSSSNVFQGLLDELCDYGSNTMTLRLWCQSRQDNPLLQSLQESVQVQLREIDRRNSHLMEKVVAPKEGTIVSLLKLQQALQHLIRPTSKLSGIVKTFQAERYSHGFRCLEILYNESCTSHASEDTNMYEIISRTFLHCFDVYLRPLSVWMEAGQLSGPESNFFISASQSEVEPASYWQDLYKLRKTPDGKLHAPKFLDTKAAHKIFNAGKSVVILEKLGKSKIVEQSHKIGQQAADISVDSRFRVQQEHDSSGLTPFAEGFGVAVERWIENRHHAASETLRRTLFSDYGLGNTLKALGRIYFMQDGVTAGLFASTIFDSLDSWAERWNDRFLLTELAQNTIGILDGVVPDRLKVYISSHKYDSTIRARRTVKSLASLEFRYNLPWPIQIVVTQKTIPSYQQIFNFLLQIRRSTYVLERIRLLGDDDNNNSSADERALFYGVRTRLLWFTSTLYDHLTTTVIDLDTRQMLREIENAEDIDSMIVIHEQYIKNLIERSLLGTRLSSIHEAFISLLDLSIRMVDARKTHTATQGSHQSSSYKIQKSKQRTRKSERRRAASSDDEDSNEEEEDAWKDQSIISADMTEVPYFEQLLLIKDQFDRLCRFVTTGLRAVARAGEHRSWEMLAERLESGLDVKQR